MTKTFNKDDILSIAMNHFWIYGYDNSSLDDLLKAMKIKKSSFYRTFKNKEDLLSQSLDLYIQEGIKNATALKEKIGVRNTLLTILDVFIKNLETSNSKKGCLITNTGRESFGKYEHLTTKINNELNVYIKFTTELISEAKEKGEIKNPLDAKIIATRYLTTRTGLSTMIQSGIDKESIEDIKKSIEELLT